MHHETFERTTLENDLRHAISKNELQVVYQPIVTLDTGELRGFEALLRWNHTKRGEIPPLVFVPIAEESGQICDIGAWAMQQAVGKLADWQRRFERVRPLTMSVNVSRRQFAGGELARLVRSALDHHAIAPGTLALEITESTVMHDIDSACTLLNEIRAMNVGIYLDDFGTGYSSLSCLHRLPLDVLKIDRAFIESASERREYAAVVHAIIALAHNIDTKLVAEGVETAEHVTMLQALDCDLAQGYFFGKPMDAREVENVLGSRGAHPVAA
jgi:EAL domain-containing protein (putative c-di-GMP-specific phosphodiesterase class I)